ncbi:MAG: DNA polymerase III subunit gamma/tau [Clostridia bacterium]|nr:DNA polymerase III subunit gamma/tau [Clostridia bacterium]
MAYQALYRRLRPQRFEDVAGQEHIIKTLENQIENNRINHAYLFCGTRGTGKTTTAKIFARAINCIGEGKKPCNKCSVCQPILQGTSVNVIEIDAASNNGVDNIRDIIEEVQYPPTDCKYKVYIIDEVHMLSSGAFNALLKTLEEPPEYVVFILATTDPQKMPVTVLSRCQRFDFHRISKDTMVKVLKEYMEEENAEVSDEAIEYIAELSDGAMRDALSILDQCISFYFDQEVTVDKVMEITGSVDRSVFFELTEAMNVSDSGKCMDIIDKIVIQGRDIGQFVFDLITHFRNILLAVSTEGETKALDYSKDYVDKLREQGKSIGYEYVMSLISAFSELANQIKFSANPRILLEVCAIKGCNPVVSYDFGSVNKRLKTLEEKIEKGAVLSAPVVAAENVRQENAADEKKEEAVVIEKAVPEDIKNVISMWNKFVKSVGSDMLRSMISTQARPAFLEDDYLTLVTLNNGSLFYLESHMEEVKKSFENYFGKDFEIRVMTEDKYNKRHIEKYGAKDPELKELRKEDFNVLGDFVQFEE